MPAQTKEQIIEMQRNALMARCLDLEIEIALLQAQLAALRENDRSDPVVSYDPLTITNDSDGVRKPSRNPIVK